MASDDPKLSVNSEKYSRLKNWTKILTLSGSAQLIVQLVGLVSGILTIRLLPTKEYALYTIVNAMLGTMTVLSDGGISTGVMAQGGKVWQDRDRLGEVMVTGYALRRQFAIFSLIISVPLLYYLLLRQEASFFDSTILVLSIIPAFLAAMSDSLLEICIKLQQDIIILQRNQVFVAILRLLAMAFLFFFPWAFLAISLTGIPRIWGNWKLKRITEKYANWNRKVNPEEKSQIKKVVRRVLPGAVYYAFSGQITTWLISIFGNSSSVAEIGALGRITILLSIFTSVFGNIIIPRYARLSNNRSLLLKRYIQIITVLIIICTFVVFSTWLFSTQILWVLGDKYINLSDELVLSMVGSTISMISGASFMLTSGRGWVLNPLITISINIISIVIGIWIFPISTLHGILVFNIFVSSIQAVRAIMYGLLAINRVAP